MIALLAALTAFAAEPPQDLTTYTPWSGALVGFSAGKAHISGSLYQQLGQGMWLQHTLDTPLSASLFDGGGGPSFPAIDTRLEIGWDSLWKRLTWARTVDWLKAQIPAEVIPAGFDDYLWEQVPGLVLTTLEQARERRGMPAQFTESELAAWIASMSSEERVALVSEIQADLAANGHPNTNNPDLLRVVSASVAPMVQQGLYAAWARNRLTPSAAMARHGSVSLELSGSYQLVKAYFAVSGSTVFDYHDFSAYGGVVGRAFLGNLYLVGRTGVRVRQDVETQSLQWCVDVDTGQSCEDRVVIDNSPTVTWSPEAQAIVGWWNDDPLLQTSFVPGVEARTRFYADLGTNQLRWTNRATVFVGESETGWGLRTGLGVEWTHALDDQGGSPGRVVAVGPVIFLSAAFDTVDASPEELFQLRGSMVHAPVTQSAEAPTAPAETVATTEP